jgi:hypothetical protein
VLADGHVAYRVKNPRGHQTHRVMTPTQFLARLCALIPPPRHPLVRFHGVFAPHSSWRRHVVALARCNLAVDHDAKARAYGQGAARSPDPNSDALRASAGPVENCGPAALDARRQAAIFPPVESTVAHDTRIDWATLLKRIHGIEALACPCGGRLRVIALITEPEVAAAILTSLHLPPAAPPISKAHSPDYYDPAPD